MDGSLTIFGTIDDISVYKFDIKKLKKTLKNDLKIGLLIPQ